MNPAVPSPEARQPGEPRGIRSLPTRITYPSTPSGVGIVWNPGPPFGA